MSRILSFGIEQIVEYPYKLLEAIVVDGSFAQSSVAYAEHFHGRFHSVASCVICIWCALCL